MIPIRFIPVVTKQITRQRTRSLLTVAGVSVAMFLFIVVQATQTGVRAATEVAADDTTLVVYRENRYCPFSSQLPQHYQPRIERLAGVKSATPIRILISNCRASLDVVTFRGIPSDAFTSRYANRFTILEGSLDSWTSRSDAAFVGESLAIRRGVKTGDRFTAAGVSVYVAGIFRTDEPQDRNVAYTHLPFLQETMTRGGTGGVVTQFNVMVDDPSQLETVADLIDTEFANDQEPTNTSPEKAFVATAASDVIELVRFAGWIGYGSLAAVFALVANAIVLSVQDRVRDHAVLQTLGFSGNLVGRLIVAEGLLLGIVGGAFGATGAWFFVKQGRFSLTMEGQNVEVLADPRIAVIGFFLAAALGALAGLVPAFQASRREIAACFRAV